MFDPCVITLFNINKYPGIQKFQYSIEKKNVTLFQWDYLLAKAAIEMAEN